MTSRFHLFSGMRKPPDYSDGFLDLKLYRTIVPHFFCLQSLCLLLCKHNLLISSGSCGLLLRKYNRITGTRSRLRCFPSAFTPNILPLAPVLKGHGAVAACESSASVMALISSSRVHSPPLWIRCRRSSSAASRARFHALGAFVRTCHS